MDANIPNLGNIATPYWGATHRRAPAILPNMGNRLKDLREARGWTQEETAEQFGMSKSGYVKLERSERKLSDNHIATAAATFGVSQAEIIADDSSAAGKHVVPVMGRIGAGAEIEPDFEQVPEDGLYTIEVPFALPDEMIALEVKGDSQLPRYNDGDVIVVWRDQRRATDTFLGEEVAVRTASGRRYLKTLQRGQRGYNLLSWNAKPIEGVRLEWIGEIYVIVPFQQIRRGWSSSSRSTAMG